MRRSSQTAALFLSFVVSALLSGLAISAPALPVDQDAITSSFGRQVQVLVDAPLSMGPAEALQSNRLTPYPDPLVNLGPQNTPAWIRFEIHNRTDEWGAWVLNTLRSNLEVLEIYKADADGISLLFDNADDAQRRESLKRYFNLVAPFSLAPGESATLLIRFKAAVAGWLPMRLIPTSMLTRFTFSQFSLFIFTTAGTGILISYNLLLFLATRNRIYVLYTAATTALLLACLHLQGMTTAWWFYSSPEWGRIFGATMVNLAGAMLLTFARLFLNLRGRPIADGWQRIAMPLLLAHVVCLPASMLLAPGLSDLLVTSGWVTVTAVFISLPIQAFTAYRGWRLEETLLGVAWTILAAQFVTLMLSTAGILPGGYMDWYLLGPACFTEAALVAVSIALKVRRLQLEKEEADTRSQMSLQEMNERARLVLAASHDAHNLIGGALSLSRRAADAPDLMQAKSDAGKVSQLLDSIRQTMSLMVSNNRQVGPGTIPMVETVQVDDLFETLALTFREHSGKHDRRITWRSNCETVACDRHMLIRILSNLISNALAYSSGKRVLVACRGHANHVSFRVYDQGPGIADADLRRLLQSEKSLRLAPEAEGSGVGLRICQALAGASGGRIEAASRPEGGSMFGLRLPTPDLSAISHPIHFVGDGAMWGGYADLIGTSRLVSEHGGDKNTLYVFSESVEMPANAGVNVVACYDRSSENRARWSQFADAIVCFPITLPALAYAASLACGRHAGESNR